MVGRMTPGDNHSAYTPFANDASEHSAPKQRRPDHGIDRASPDTSKFDAAPEATERQGRDKTRHRLWGCSKLRRQPLLSPRILSHNHRRVAHPGEVRHRRFHFPHLNPESADFHLVVHPARYSSVPSGRHFTPSPVLYIRAAGSTANGSGPNRAAVSFGRLRYPRATPAPPT